MKSSTILCALSSLLLFAEATSWQDVGVAAIGAVVTLSGIYQVITLAKIKRDIEVIPAMKKDIEVIHTTTNSLSEKLQTVTAAKAKLEGRDEEREKVAENKAVEKNVQDKIAEGIRVAMANDNITPSLPLDGKVAADVKVVKEVVHEVRSDVKDVKDKFDKV